MLSLGWVGPLVTPAFCWLPRKPPTAALTKPSLSFLDDHKPQKVTALARRFSLLRGFGRILQIDVHGLVAGKDGRVG
jgi:hypothetical protein